MVVTRATQGSSPIGNDLAQFIRCVWGGGQPGNEATINQEEPLKQDCRNKKKQEMVLRSFIQTHP